MKWLHNLLKGLSLTACLFVFQACYGTPPGYPEDVNTEDLPAEASVQPATAEEALPELEVSEVPMN